MVAANRINKEGGIAGRKVELLVEDDAGKPAEAVRIMKKHVLQDNADFIIGGARVQAIQWSLWQASWKPSSW
jgi:branched-chain amino acid transport system substrate-binding protein